MVSQKAPGILSFISFFYMVEHGISAISGLVNKGLK